MVSYGSTIAGPPQQETFKIKFISFNGSKAEVLEEVLVADPADTVMEDVAGKYAGSCAMVTINTAMDRKRPRSADMCGQFEDIVGAVPPPRQRSSQPLSQPLPAPTVVGDTAFFDFNRYEQERTIQCQHPIPTHTFTSLSMTIGDTNQSITSSQQRDEDTAPYFLDLDMDLDTSGFPALDPYSPDLNICMNTSGFLA
jgi:hypothetical protein